MNGYVFNVEENGKENFMTDFEKKTKTCSKCNTPITKKNRVRYTGAFGYRKQCRECLRKQSHKHNKKKQKVLREWKSFYS